MERTVTLEHLNLTVTVKELTVGDIRTWLREIQELKGFDLVDGALFQEEGASIDDLLRMTSLDKAEVDQLTPADLAKVLEKCKKVNPHFFRFRAAVLELGTRPEMPTPSEHSSVPPSRP